MKVEYATKANVSALSTIHIGDCFCYNGQAYIKAAPVKSLVRSTLVHEVITRGDFFVVALVTGALTVVSGQEQIIPLDSKLQYSYR